jgi:hypothetical protein
MGGMGGHGAGGHGESKAVDAEEMALWVVQFARTD